MSIRAEELISIVLVNWNGGEYIKPCIESLRRQTYRNVEIVVVDNGSKDKSLEILQGYKDIRIIPLSENKGFAEGCNIGVSEVKGKYILSINTDTYSSKDLIEKLYNHIKNHDCVAVCPLTLDVKSTIEYSDNPDLSKLKQSINGTLNVVGHNYLWLKDDEVFGFYPAGNCVMFDKDIIGLPFDNDYFIYSEDVYMGWLMRLRGLKWCRIEDTYIFHLTDKDSSKRIRPFIIYHDNKNRMMNLLIFYEVKNIIKIVPLLILDQIGALIFLPKKPIINGIIWIIKNIKNIYQKRKVIQNKRVVDDEEIIRHMTSKLDCNHKYRYVNPISELYCWIVGLKTREQMKGRIDVK